MRKEYDFSKMKARKNPYVAKLLSTCPKEPLGQRTKVWIEKSTYVCCTQVVEGGAGNWRIPDSLATPDRQVRDHFEKDPVHHAIPRGVDTIARCV